VSGSDEIRRTVLLDVFWSGAGDPECGTCEVKVPDLAFVSEKGDAFEKVRRKICHSILRRRTMETKTASVSMTAVTALLIPVFSLI
jgi:hypothetical protein